MNGVGWWLPTGLCITFHCRSQAERMSNKSVADTESWLSDHDVMNAGFAGIVEVVSLAGLDDDTRVYTRNDAIRDGVISVQQPFYCGIDGTDPIPMGNCENCHRFGPLRLNCKSCWGDNCTPEGERKASDMSVCRDASGNYVSPLFVAMVLGDYPVTELYTDSEAVRELWSDESEYEEDVLRLTNNPTKCHTVDERDIEERLMKVSGIDGEKIGEDKLWKRSGYTFHRTFVLDVMKDSWDIVAGRTAFYMRLYVRKMELVNDSLSLEWQKVYE